MKFTNFKLMEYKNVLARLEERGKLGYAIARNLRIITDAVSDYCCAHDKIIMDHADLQSDGTYKIRDNELYEANKEIEEVGSIELDLPLITVDENTFCSGNLTSQDMYVLDWMVTKDGGDN